MSDVSITSVFRGNNLGPWPASFTTPSSCGKLYLDYYNVNSFTSSCFIGWGVTCSVVSSSSWTFLVPNPDCWPVRTLPHYDLVVDSYWSPASICPSGWWKASTSLFTGASFLEEEIFCCPLSHNYKSTVPGCEGQEQSSIELASCAPLGTTFADATTTITGLVIPYVRAIQMRHAYNQGAEATSTPITDTPSLSSSQPSALSSPTAISDGKQDTSFSPNHGLSSRARIAIGVTVPLVVLSITTLIVFWFFFRAKRRSAVVTEPIESANGNDCDLPEVAFHNDTSRGLATVEGTSPYTELESPQNAVVFSSHAELGMPDPASNRSELPVGERLVSPQHAPKPEMAELSENLVSSELDASAMVSRPLSSAELEVAASQSVLQPSQVEVNQPRSSHNVSACDSALPEVVPVTAALEILSDEELKARRVKVARDREKLERMVELDRLREEEERIVEETTRRTGYI